MMFSTNEKAETPLGLAPVPTEQRTPPVPMQDSMLFEPSPPTVQRKKSKANKPPKPVQHAFNPSRHINSGDDIKLSAADTADEIPSNSAFKVELLMERVHELASESLEQSEKPTLHHQLKMLDLILQGQDPTSDVPSTEVANAVYRLLIKREK